jgi:hypothetical protein
MRYMLLIYTAERAPEDVPREEMARVAATHHSVMADARRKNVLVAAEPLRPTTTATTLRREGERWLTVDGPFAETKEQLAGYYILDCADLDEAIEWAKRIPTACGGAEGCVEIRPIQPLTNAPGD